MEFWSDGSDVGNAGYRLLLGRADDLALATVVSMTAVLASLTGRLGVLVVPVLGPSLRHRPTRAPELPRLLFDPASTHQTPQSCRLRHINLPVMLHRDEEYAIFLR